MSFRMALLVLSDSRAAGEREDTVIPTCRAALAGTGLTLAHAQIIPDDRRLIVDTLVEWVDKEGLSLIITSGGTGLSPTDITPQAMLEVIDYQVPGMAEAMRAESLKKTPHAMISRAIAGVRGSCLIINLPGSPGGVKDNLTVILPALTHALSKLGGDTTDCAT